MKRTHRPLVAIIIGLTLLVALLDFWTSAALVGSILFTFPIALCALQRSKRLLWGAAVAAAFLTIAAEFWGFNRAGLQNPGVSTINRGLLIASLFTLTGILHSWIKNSQKIVLNAAEIERQNTSLVAQKEQLEILVTAATRDIGVRKAAEEHLARMEGRYRGLLEAAPDAMVVVNQGGDIVLLNVQAEKQFGYRRDELIGQEVKNIIPEGFAERLIADDLRSAAEALAQQIGTGIELVGRRKNGSSFPMEIMLSPLESAEGILVTAAIRDISVRKAAEKHLAQIEDKRRIGEEALRDSEEKYRMLLDGVHDYAIFMLDPRGRIESWNAGAERIKGYKATEIIGRNFSCFFSPEDIKRGKPEEALRMTAASGRHEEQGMRVRKDGSQFMANVTLTALHDPAGELRGFSEISRDLSELKESEARYRGLLEAAPDAMVISNAQGRIVLVNAATERQFGYRRDELVGQPVELLVPDRLREIHPKHRKEYAAHPGTRSTREGMELSALRKDGSEFPVEIMLSPLETAEGTLVTAAIRDISARKAAENHLAQMEGRYRGLLEAAPDAMVVVNQAGEIVLLNVQAEKQFGYRRDELIGQKVKNIIPEGFAERLIADDLRSTEAALAQQIGMGIELIARRKDGSGFPIEIMLSPLKSDEGILVTAAIRDVTARKEAEQALRDNEENLRLTVEAAEMGTWFWNIQRDEIRWSEKFRALFGLASNATLTYKEITQVIHPDDRQRLDQSVKNALEQGVPFDIEYRVVWPDSSEHWIAAKGQAHRSNEGTAISMQGIVLDVTERKKALEAQKHDEAREQRSVELKRSNDDLQQFAYIAAHDLQEPLRMVASYTQLLSKRYKGKLDPDADEFISFAVDGAHRMQLLIGDLLAYCRVGTTGKEFRETSSEAALEQAVLNLQGAIRESGGVVTHDPLPTVVADGAQLQQLFQNVVGNAIKYRSGEVPRVHISAKRNGGNEWIFSMRDNGLGIDPKYFDKIFVMFQRLHGREEFSGTGIGLTLCKKIAERHGGRMWLDSEPGKGSTFYFAIPDRS
jgi:PAS domain S-box-containing protein